MTVYAVITEQILEALSQGLTPWRQPWSAAGAPRNLVSGRAYRGINTFLLGLRGFTSPYWLTFNQAKERGGFVRKGEKATKIIFWRIIPPTDENEERELVLLRYYRVFNVSQCEGIEVPAPPVAAPFDPVASAEALLSGIREDMPTVRHRGNMAAYRPEADEITMPPKESFDSPACYYETLFHELTHATGHPSRLGRIEGVACFGDPTYGREELVAEMGSAFLCAEAGLPADSIQRAAAYLQGWMKAIRADERMVITAASAAQKAVDYLLQREGGGDAPATEAVEADTLQAA